MADDERVSLAEIVEVRDSGFNSAELLAIIYASCEHLLSRQNARRGLFSPALIFINSNGRINIDFLESVMLEFTPPEMRDNPHSTVEDPQLVWCLGEIVRQVSQADCADADLFSLINVMTVSHEPTRPTIQRLLQMAKNKIANPESIPNVLLTLYQEVLGDIEDLADDSEMESVVAPPVVEPPRIYTTKIAQMTRASTSVSSTPAVSTTSHSELQSLSSSDEGSLVEYKENAENVLPTSTPTESGRKQAAIVAIDDNSSLSRISESSEKISTSSTPSTPVVETPKTKSIFSTDLDPIHKLNEEPELKQHPLREYIKENRTPPIETHSPQTTYNSQIREEPEIKPQAMHVEEERVPVETSVASVTYFSNTNTLQRERTNATPVEVEVHHELSRPSTPVQSMEQHNEVTPTSARRRSSGIVASIREEDDQSISTNTTPLHQATTVSPSSFSRHNSMQSSNIRRRSTARRNNRKTTSVPEFVEKRSLPMIRLRAQSQKRRRMSLLRVEDTLVLVKLLNGQSIELNCRSDVLVLNIFDTVVTHLNISEGHTFFGLSVLKGSEFYFLDNDQRLEKFAPSGWKTIVKHGSAPNFTLYLRFKFYPKRTDFVRNEITMHLLYLQLRQDILSGILTASQEQIIEAGATALQAEFSDRPNHVTEYFDIHNYLPSSLLAGLRSDDLKNIHNMLVQRHTELSGSNRRHSERAFIQLAQTFPCFGAHFYAVYKFKPAKKQDRSSLINDIQNIQLIAIMPHGVGICRNAAKLQVDETVEWPFIRVLQYDGKRFLIATIENNIAVDHIFYTDHFTKSRYLVRFAADQHKFMLRMRQWQSALVQSRMPDVGINESLTDPLQQPSSRQQKARDVDMSSEQIESMYGSDAIRLNVTLEKHPSHGLGLTLVDGSVNGNKGVYVKSLASDGDGRKKGLQVGDCILKISDVSLFNRSRHDAVDLVKQCETEVKMEVLRFHSITAVLGESTGHPSTTTTSSDSTITVPTISDRKDSKESTTPSKKSWPAPKFPDEANANLTDKSRTPPPQRKTQSSSAVVQKRQRAVSDFGAIGDSFPKMSSDFLLQSMEKLYKPVEDDSDSSDNENDKDLDKSGVYPVNDMYNFHRDELDFPMSPTSVQNTSLNYSDTSERNGNLYQQRGKSRSDMKPDKYVNGAIKAIEKSANKNSNLDWTHDLSDIEDEEKSEHSNLINIQMNRIPGHSLGFRVASSNQRVYVKQVNSEPAISAKIMTDDRIISINGHSVDGLTHNEVVNLLREGNVVRLVVERADDKIDPPEETITVVLDKSQSSSLGLSLAKKMGCDGIFIRNIVSGSVADQEGSLKVGDQLLVLDGKQIVNEHPNEIIEMLKQISGTFSLVVKREL